MQLKSSEIHRNTVGECDLGITCSSSPLREVTRSSRPATRRCMLCAHEAASSRGERERSRRDQQHSSNNSIVHSNRAIIIVDIIITRNIINKTARREGGPVEHAGPQRKLPVGVLLLRDWFMFMT